MVVSTKAQRPKQIRETGSWMRSERNDDHTRTRGKQASTAVVTSAPTNGQANWLLRFSIEALRQAMSGPTPVRNSSTRPIGVIHLLKNGGPTVMRWPVTHSDSVGNSVAVRMKKAADSRIQLLIRKANSREIQESSSLRLRRSGRRYMTRPKEKTVMMPIQTRKITASSLS